MNELDKQSNTVLFIDEEDFEITQVYPNSEVNQNSVKNYFNETDQTKIISAEILRKLLTLLK